MLKQISWILVNHKDLVASTQKLIELHCEVVEVLSNRLHKSALVSKEWKESQNWGMQGSTSP